MIRFHRTAVAAIAAILTPLVLVACGSTTPSAPTAVPAVVATSTSVAAPADRATSTPAEAPNVAATPTTAAAATEAPDQAVEPTGAQQTPAATVAPAAAIAKLNLNTLTGDELLSTIPGFSNRMVREFLEYRPYVSIQQFRREIGKYVDDSTVAEYEKYVYVPISVDEADAATLEQVPGVDAAVAEALIAARPFGSNAAFLAKLAELAPGADSAVATSYLAAE